MHIASYLTDEEREQRYVKLRKKKKCSDILVAIPILTGIVLFIAELFNLPMTFVNIATGTSVLALFLNLAPMVSAAVTAFCAFSRKVKIVLVAISAVILIDMISGGGMSLLLIPALICALIGAHIFEKLEQEEGFPLFRIPFSELEERRQNTEKKGRFRAEQNGTRRVADSEVHGTMGDLLDEAEDVPVQISALQGYFGRSEGAQGVFSAPANEAGKYGKMDEL